MSQPRSNGSRPVLRVRTRGTLFPDLERIQTDPRVDPPPGKCFNCWQAGHKFDKCPLPMRELCPNCGRREVDLLTCPRCNRVYREWVEGKRQFDLNEYCWYHNRKPRPAGSRGGRGGSRGWARMNARVPYTRGRNSCIMSLSDSTEGTLGDPFDVKTLGSSAAEMTSHRDEDDFATAEYRSIGSSLRGGSSTDCPSSAGATCPESTDLIGRVTNLLHMMAPLSASTQSLVMRGIFYNMDEDFVNGMEVSSEHITDENGM